MKKNLFNNEPKKLPFFFNDFLMDKSLCVFANFYIIAKITEPSLHSQILVMPFKNQNTNNNVCTLTVV